MVDPYLYPDVPVLKNKMEIKTKLKSHTNIHIMQKHVCFMSGSNRLL